jgi:hypothetical protein
MIRHLILFLVASSSSAMYKSSETFLSKTNADTTKNILQNISEWILTTNLPSNNLSNTNDHLKTSIFINGNLARTLLAASQIFQNSTYLETGLKWCDTFVELQHDQKTNDGRSVGGWWDTGYSDLYIADTGTAVTCLALCYDLTTSLSRKKKYMNSMLKFSEFVVNGTATTPVCDFTPDCQYDENGNNTEVTDTWLVGDGSLGDGYYMKNLNTKSYTIATATTGGAFFAEMYALTGRLDFKNMASKATEWLLSHVQQNGTIPYYISPATTIPHEYQCTSYSAEAIIDADLRGLLDSFKLNVTVPAKRMIEYLLQNQQPNGELIDPKIASIGEQQRSPRALSILQWYYQITLDIRAKEAINKYIHFLQQSDLSFDPNKYGINSYALVTGFVGLGLADLILPWCTFSKGL